jgi:hypothetical protein
MALPQGAISKLIEILNDRDKRGPGGPGGPGKPVEAYQGGRTPTPTGRSNEFNYAGGLDAYLQEAARRGLDVSNIKSAEDLQGRIYDSLMASKEGQGIIRNMWKDYGDTLKGSGKILPENLSEQDLAGLRSSFVDNKLGGRTQMVLAGMKPVDGGGGGTPEKDKTGGNPRPPEDPTSKYVVQGRLPYGEREPVFYFQKDYEGFKKVQQPLGVQYSVESYGTGPEGSMGAQTRYEYDPSYIREQLKNNPEALAALGEGYVQKGSIGGKMQWQKLKEAEAEWNNNLMQKLMKSGFKGQELEGAMARESQRNPYRTRQGSY